MQIWLEIFFSMFFFRDMDDGYNEIWAEIANVLTQIR